MSTTHFSLLAARVAFGPHPRLRGTAALHTMLPLGLCFEAWAGPSTLCLARLLTYSHLYPFSSEHLFELQGKPPAAPGFLIGWLRDFHCWSASSTPCCLCLFVNYSLTASRLSKTQYCICPESLHRQALKSQQDLLIQRTDSQKCIFLKHVHWWAFLLSPVFASYRDCRLAMPPLVSVPGRSSERQ
jgi:hypothetical protein